ncbi:MAG: YifB family Mg chelatase-like AAA ATPase [Bacteroidales bacterium]|nr:ATP-binding protein [Bacteroidales bacterium]MBQ6687754.1 YifB family Mg chelatase-like AAA ATPase [Bacteroidales bacterium]
MLINIHCAKCIGTDAVPVTVEVDITNGLGIHLVGLADAAVKESLLRTITALQSMGYRIPGKKIVINLAPADMHKKGSGYDVPIALGIIAASRQRDLPLLEKFMIMGELGLDGSVRDIPGSLPIAELAKKSDLIGCILPEHSALETMEYEGVDVYGVKCLEDVLNILSCTEGCENLLTRNHPVRYVAEDISDSIKESDIMDFKEIIGQEAAKRGLEIAAAGGHNAILIGSPGSGKSSLAKALAGILPPMTLEESLQTSKVYSVAGKANPAGGLIKQRPFRAPHYSASLNALLGGGSDTILPGEISLAHNGVLFMDEFCETPKKIIEALRAPIEDRKIIISRLKSKVEYPADFMLIAAANPCPCGYYGEGNRCTCTPAKRLGYISRLSGPIMDRIDIQLVVSRVDARRLVNREKAESSADIAARVLKAREIQRRRFAGTLKQNDEYGTFCNASMNSSQLEQFCPLSKECRIMLEKIIERNGLSARACTRIIKLARTIADLAQAQDILPEHISEAAGYRFLDRQNIME